MLAKYTIKLFLRARVSSLNFGAFRFTSSTLFTTLSQFDRAPSGFSVWCARSYGSLHPVCIRMKFVILPPSIVPGFSEEVFGG